jgi:hypothetical protein
MVVGPSICTRINSLHVALCPLLRKERILVNDVLGEVLAPRRHGALVHLGDGKSALVLPLLVGDKARWGSNISALALELTSWKFMSRRGLEGVMKE